MEPNSEHQQAADQLAQWTSATAEEEHPACQSCRRRKLKCSRNRPNCSQCLRLEIECLYVPTRKPGMRSGAIEALNRRLQAVEEIVLQDRSITQAQPSQQETNHSLYHVSLVLAKELQRLGSHPCATNPELISSEATQDFNSRKRKRQEQPEGLRDLDENSLADSLPDDQVIEAAVDNYFQTLHHWVPFLHQSRFRLCLAQPQYRQELAIVLHAMVCATMKFLAPENYGLEQSDVKYQIRRSRQAVILSAMSCPSIEHLQALIIIAFDHMGCGEMKKAWSLVGSLTRTIEYLRMTSEPDALQQDHLRRPITLLDAPSSWTEVEQRRRLFWNVFLLDRFCSVTTGWSTSLTSDDVHRKLPCDGGLWAREERSDTPYFGIWNKSAARIGNSIAFIPAHYPTPDHEIDHDSVRSPGTTSNTTVVDTSKLGAFAYCIEATESLSQVTTFFLQQKVDFRDRQEVGSWLTRFKELDLRLVHWKMFLPQKWKDSNISRDVTLIDMDPNLTLAHLTHNTSMILLHQHIAYPPPDWKDLVKLPSACSAETCQMAAMETASISQKYLKYTMIGIVNSQFALCAFVAGRMLLVHWRFYDAELAAEFFGLVESLKEMSRRWRGISSVSITANADRPRHGLDLAGQYAALLEEFHTALLHQPGYYMHVLGYNKDPATGSVDCLLPYIRSSKPLPRSQDRRATNNFDRTPLSANRSHFGAAESSNFRSRRFPEDTNLGDAAASTPATHLWDNAGPSANQVGMTQIHADFDTNSVEDELTAMSNVLLGQQFLEMDRVITYDGTNFAIDLGGWPRMG
ncbi:hypothetical protein BDZ45DRAFT_586331 [Acephala macrosclerotiorum]|nr:hypothetical protein BDZ45DRAFT_586331 [Acephala macrosclerotiorum]